MKAVIRLVDEQADLDLCCPHRTGKHIFAWCGPYKVLSSSIGEGSVYICQPAIAKYSKKKLTSASSIDLDHVFGALTVCCNISSLEKKKQ